MFNREELDESLDRIREEISRLHQEDQSSLEKEKENLLEDLKENVIVWKYLKKQNKKKTVQLTKNVDKFSVIVFVKFLHSSLSSQVFIMVRRRISSCPVGWGCRIHRLLLCRGVRPPPNECPGYDTKQSDGEVPAMLELWGMRSTPSLPSLPGPLWPGVLAPDKGPIYGLNRTKPCFFHYTDFCI